MRTSNNLLTIFWSATLSECVPMLETSSDRSREVPNTSSSSVADGSLWTGGHFLLRNGVGTLRVEANSRFTVSSLDAGCSRGLSSSSSETAVRSGQTRSLSFSSSSGSRVRAGYADFCFDRAKVTCFFGRADRARDFGWYARLVKTNTIFPIVEYSAGEEYKPKAGHVMLSPFGFSAMVRPRFCICGRENRIGTSPVSSTSTLVEHGGVVGK